MKQTRDLGISEFILNPFTIKDLPRAIRRVMDGGGVMQSKAGHGADTRHTPSGGTTTEREEGM